METSRVSKSYLEINYVTVADRIIKKTSHKFQFIDLGGGMGISYNNKNKKLNYKKYSIAIKKFLKKHPHQFF